MNNGGESTHLPSKQIDEMAALPVEQAISFLQERGSWNVPSALELAEWALERAEVDASQAKSALHLAALISSDFGEPAHLQAQIAYGEARRAVHAGDLLAGEAALLLAQEKWRALGAHGAYARTFLGLTQVLAMQGRYVDAASAAQGAIETLLALVESEPNMRLLLSRAYRNRANLLAYQEHHAAARDAYSEATVELEQFRQLLPPEEQANLEEEFGHLALNLASAHTFLDAPDQAEVLLREAITRFDHAGDWVNRGRAQTNLGRLYLRMGEYATALNAFDLASRDLIGEVANDTQADANDQAHMSGENDLDLAQLRLADELLLEHALAYLALNLLPEAASALERCEQLFRATGQPYELAQCRYALGVLRLQQREWAESRAALDEALALFRQLDNRFWRNRTQTALARLAQLQGQSTESAALLDALLADAMTTTPVGAVAWDLLGLVDLWLMRMQLWLDAGEIEAAEQASSAVARLLGIQDESALPQQLPLPHLSLRLYHARGRISHARGDMGTARKHLAHALELLDHQRAALPLEEVRTAYLDDKLSIYADLVTTLLNDPLPSEDEVAAAFAVVERARSRALLERLLASVDNAGVNESDVAGAQRVALRRQLHWLYNQLLGEGGNRRLDGQLGREVAKQEAAIQRLEWRRAPLLAQAEPVKLAELQAILGDDQQALAYYFAGSEVMVFIISRGHSTVVRRLTTVEQLEQAHAELRFQLGRAEMGSDYVARNQQRLLRGVQEALGRLYQLLVAPLVEQLPAHRLLLIPYGLLHLLPFHAMWDGTRYWLEQKEIGYVPSASIAVHKKSGRKDDKLRSFAGLAPFDERIPQAKAEVNAASKYFESAELYCDEQATIERLSCAAATCDVLHLATHGLFRPDNSFFSALKLADGWIDVREIYRLKLSAKLVVLSACESGVGEVRGGDEVVGLARGFLAAGAQKLIASLWNVHDTSAAELMDSFYEILQGGIDNALSQNDHKSMETATALRMAQIKTLRNGVHPYFWAPFFAIG